MKDQKDGTITATKVTYTQIKDADGNTIDEGKQTPVDYNDGSDTTKPKSTPPSPTPTPRLCPFLVCRASL